jgi:hypothetical protein
MQTNDILNTIKRFDAYPKTLEDFRVKTLGGGAGRWFVFVDFTIKIQTIVLALVFNKSFLVSNCFCDD